MKKQMNIFANLEDFKQAKELLEDIEALKEKYQVELSIKIQEPIDHYDYSPSLETV